MKRAIAAATGHRGPGLRRWYVLAGVLAIGAALAPKASLAAEKALATTPLATASAVQAKPNLMFILDGSGSMDSAYMPDEAQSRRTETYAYRASQCNGLAYDPNYDYTANRPLQADGATPYANASTTATPDDGFNPSAGSTDVRDRYYYTYDSSVNGSAPRMGWTYTASGVITSTDFYKQCTSEIGDNPGRRFFAKVLVSSLSAAQLQNYANWHAYFRTRMLLMKTAAGRAFSALNANYRVGFTTIDSTGVSNDANFHDVGDFNSVQKTAFLTKLYGRSPSNYTPLRGALSKVGRYYANKIAGQTDPVQYSCQRNYTILSTDGYWNADIENASYGPLALDGSTTVGQQDGAVARPQYDGSHSISTAVTPTSSVARVELVTTTTTTTPWTRYRWVVASSSTGCSNGRVQVSTLRQARNQTTTLTNTEVVDLTTTRTRTVVTTDGVVTSDTTSERTTTATVSTNTATSDSAGTWAASGTASTQCVRTSDLAGLGLSQGGTFYSAGNSNNSTKTSDSNYAGVAGTPVALTVGPLSTTLSLTGPTVGATTTTTTSTGGSSNSLADVAQYYYMTDLRTGTLGNCSAAAVGTDRADACANNVPTSGHDTANWQHMTTSTIGLGVSGTLTYDPNYLTQTSGDYVAVSQGTKDWPTPGDGREAVNIDDLWHAAVNGRGRYFSALNASSLIDAIAASLNSVTSTPGAASAAATNSLKPVAGESNQVYVATYTTVDWAGDLTAYPLDAATGIVDTNHPDWSARSRLDALAATGGRNIYYRRPGTASLRSFSYSNLNNDGLGSYFSNLCTQAGVPAQCAGLSATQKTAANSGDNLVNFLRGARTYEAGTNAADPLYRTRASVLGDIVNGAPVYVGAPPFSYIDVGYSSFKSSKTGRKKMVYAAANDGMLHAFSADAAAGDAGTELWAFVPTAVLPDLYHLADSAYAYNHRPYVDASPVTGDIKVGSAWKTILVGGLGAGGKSYYALDVTDPANPAALWEFSHANLGLSFGNPIITKRADGTWVVVVASGYNNTAGDGRGHLFVLDAATGTLLQDIPTTAGSTATPSGLAKINAWVDDPTDNTALRFYGGDLLGNLWRFDVDDRYGTSGNEATLLAQFMANLTTPQPITTAPQPISVKSGSTNLPAVIVGTGSFLGSDDVGSTTQQSIYAIKDSLTASGWGDVRQNAALVDRPITADTSRGTISGGSVDWSSQIGWKLDLPKSGERLVTDMLVQYNTLAAASAIPGSSVCTPSGGSSWLYLLDVNNGTASRSDGVASSYLGGFLAVGLTWLQRSGGGSSVEIVGSDQSISKRDATDGTPSSATTRRTSWRELTD